MWSLFPPKTLMQEQNYQPIDIAYGARIARSSCPTDWCVYCLLLVIRLRTLFTWPTVLCR